MILCGCEARIHNQSDQMIKLRRRFVMATVVTWLAAGVRRSFDDGLELHLRRGAGGRGGRQEMPQKTSYRDFFFFSPPHHRTSFSIQMKFSSIYIPLCLLLLLFLLLLHLLYFGKSSGSAASFHPPPPLLLYVGHAVKCFSL